MPTKEPERALERNKRATRSARLDPSTREPIVSQTGLGTAENEIVCELRNGAQSRDCWRVGDVFRYVHIDQGRCDISAVKSLIRIVLHIEDGALALNFFCTE